MIEIKQRSPCIMDYFASSVCCLDLKMPHGTFQRVRDVILVKVTWQFVMAYCANIITFCTHCRNTLTIYVMYYYSYQTLESRSN